MYPSKLTTISAIHIKYISTKFLKNEWYKIHVIRNNQVWHSVYCIKFVHRLQWKLSNKCFEVTCMI